MANIGYQPTVGGDLSGMPSVELWHQVDADKEARPGFWHESWEDFGDTSFDAPTSEGAFGRHKAFSSTGGLFTNFDDEGGVVTLGSDGDNEGSSVGQSRFPFKIIQDAGELVFEGRLKTTTIADTKHGIFVGLIESVALTATVPIAAAGTLSDNNFVGFHRLEADGDKFDTVYKANGITQVTIKGDAITIVADTYLKIGMIFNRGGDNVLRWYKDGVELVDTFAIPSAAGTDFPNDVRLGWILTVLNATGSTPGDSQFDWIRVAQKRTVLPA